MSRKAKTAWTPRNAAQQEAVDVFRDSSILFLLGPAGSGKTHCAVALALSEVRDEKVAIIRPAVEAGGEQYGYLPGSIDEKFAPFAYPISESLRSVRPGAKLSDTFDIWPLAFLRGRTINTCCILDEGQNCTIADLLLVLTRLGAGAKLIITADPTQSDIPNSGIMGWVSALQGVKGISFVEFPQSQNLRHPLLEEILLRRPY